MNSFDPDQLNRAQRFFDRLTQAVARRAGLVVVLTLIAGSFGAWRIGKLRISQDLKKLIPDDFPSVTRLEEVGKRLGSQNDFIIEIRGPKRDKVLAFGETLATSMRDMKPKAFHYVEFRRKTEWFKTHALLYLPIAKLLDLRARVAHRIRKEVRSKVVETLDDPAEEPKDRTEPDEDDPLELNEEKLRDKYGKQYDIPDEYIEVEDGEYTVAVIRARPLKSTNDVAFTEQLVERMGTMLKTLDASSVHPKMTAQIEGEYAARSGEVSSIKSELLGSSAYALGMLVLVIGLYFKRLRALLLILVPLIMGILLSLGISTFLFDSLNLVTAFIFVVLLGLGIDFGIHMLSRYEYERLRGHDQLAALRIMGSLTGLDVAMGALTTTLMFSLFPIADFRGFSQFGVVAAIGVVCTLVFTLTSLPAMIVLVERLTPWKPRKWLPMKSAPGAETNTSAPAHWFPSRRRQRGLAAGIIVASILVGGVGVYVSPQIEFEYDFGKLGKKKDPDQAGSKAAPKKDYTDAIGRPNFGPAMAMAADQAQGKKVEDHLRGLKLLTDSQMKGLIAAHGGKSLSGEELKHNDPERKDPPPPIDGSGDVEEQDPDYEDEEDDDDPFAETEPQKKLEPDTFAHLQAAVDRGDLAPETVRLLKMYPFERVRVMRYFLWKHMSLWSFVPSRQAEKLQIIADIRDRIEKKRGDLKPKTKKKADDFMEYLEVTEPVGLEDVPPFVRNRWMDNEGKFGRHAILWNRGAKANYHDAKQLYTYFLDLKVGDPKSPETVKLGASYFVLPEIMDTLKRDGPRVLFASLSVIFLCLLTMFRSLRLTLLVLVPVVAAVAWLAALFHYLDWKLNLYNVITFALIIGMGVDDGIHVVSRWLEDGQRSIYHAVRETGAAVALTTVTTCIGFAGLLMARHVGLATLGTTAAVGMVLCLATSLTTLPALLFLLGKRGDPDKAAT